MEVFVLDVDGTGQDIIINSQTNEESEKSFEVLNKTLDLVDLCIEPTMKNLDGHYITSSNNAAIFREMYGWNFVKLVITDL